MMADVTINCDRSPVIPGPTGKKCVRSSNAAGGNILRRDDASAPEVDL
jgi:hypothetical protein